MNTVSGQLLSSSGICQEPDKRSRVENTMLFRRLWSRSEMTGIGKRSLVVTRSNLLKSIRGHYVSSFLGIRSREEFHGEWDFTMTPWSSMSFTSLEATVH